MKEEQFSNDTNVQADQADQAETVLGDVVNTDISEDNSTNDGVDPSSNNEESSEVGDDVEEKDGEENTGAPEQYEDFKIPEGLEYVSDLAEEFKKVAKELNLDQKQAQRLVNFQAKQHNMQVDRLDKKAQEWLAESKQQFGADFNKALSTASKGIDFAFGEDAQYAREIFNNTRLGNNKVFINAMYRIGKKVQESEFVASGANTPTRQKTAAEILFGNNK